MPSIKLLLSVVLLSFVFAGCEGGYSWQVAPDPYSYPTTNVEQFRENGGFYLGTLGGAAAQTAAAYITDCRCIDFPELGMEAVWQITVKDFPAFVLTDNKGNDFYKQMIKK